jgi:hypothetical protein
MSLLHASAWDGERPAISGMRSAAIFSVGDRFKRFIGSVVAATRFANSIVCIAAKTSALSKSGSLGLLCSCLLRARLFWWRRRAISAYFATYALLTFSFSQVPLRCSSAARLAMGSLNAAQTAENGRGALHRLRRRRRGAGGRFRDSVHHTLNQFCNGHRSGPLMLVFVIEVH